MQELAGLFVCHPLLGRKVCLCLLEYSKFIGLRKRRYVDVNDIRNQFDGSFVVIVVFYSPLPDAVRPCIEPVFARRIKPHPLVCGQCDAPSAQILIPTQSAAKVATSVAVVPLQRIGNRLAILTLCKERYV